MLKRALLIVVLAALATPALAADYVHTDGSAAYVVPAGLTQTPDSRLKPHQARFDVERQGVARAGTCILGISELPADANLDSWGKMKAAGLADPDATARKSVRSPKTFVSLGGYKPLAPRGGGDGYLFWVTSSEAGRQQTDLTAVALLDVRHLYGASCSSEAGLSFTPAELTRIQTLIASVRRP